MHAQSIRSVRFVLDALIAAAVVLFAVSVAAAADSVEAVTVKDIKGNAQIIPAKDGAMVVAYVMADQDRSRTALSQLREAVGDSEGITVIAVTSGKSADADTAPFAKELGWPAVWIADPKYELSGRYKVRVWPTLVFLPKADAKGAAAPIGRIAGLPQSLLKDATAYVAASMKQISDDELDRRLASHSVVQSTQEQIAERHLHVAERLVDQQQYELARTEIESGLKANAADPRLNFLLGQLDVLTGKPTEGLKRLDTLSEKDIAGWRLHAQRGRAQFMLGRHDEALKTLTTALKLNPRPGDVHYLLGRIHEAKGDPKAACMHFRAAFESTSVGADLKQAVDVSDE